MPSIDDEPAQARPHTREDLDVNEVADGLVIYDPRTSEVHHLNVSAAAVFALCDGTHDVGGIVAEIAAILPGDATLEADVRVCLDDLDARGLLK